MSTDHARMLIRILPPSLPHVARLPVIPETAKTMSYGGRHLDGSEPSANCRPRHGG